MPPKQEVQGLLRHAIGKTLLVAASLPSSSPALARLVRNEKALERAVSLILSCMLRDLVRPKPSNKEFQKLLSEISPLLE